MDFVPRLDWSHDTIALSVHSSIHNVVRFRLLLVLREEGGVRGREFNKGEPWRHFDFVSAARAHALWVFVVRFFHLP